MQLLLLTASQEETLERRPKQSEFVFPFIPIFITYQSNSERRPLLSRPVTPNKTSYLRPTGSGSADFSSRLGRSSSSVSTPLLHNLGWIEYVLPDASSYYVHPTMRVTTDIDLRNTKKLEAVTSYFDHKNAGAAVGLEVWLQDLTTTKRGFVPATFLVDHRRRCVAFESPMAKNGASGKSKYPEDDRKCRALPELLQALIGPTGLIGLDMEYRYWSFMEAHPAHVALPGNARVEAIDALSWAYAGL